MGKLQRIKLKKNLGGQFFQEQVAHKEIPIPRLE
jgi:hypothetical protein